MNTLTTHAKMTGMRCTRFLLALTLCTAASLASSAGQSTPVSIGKVNYPLEARAAGLEGTVRLKGTIGKDGVLHDLHVLSGPQALRDAAIETVMQYKYKPYRYNGELVEVHTTVTVNYKLGNKKEKAAAIARAQAELANAAQTPPSPGSPPPPQ